MCIEMVAHYNIIVHELVATRLSVHMTNFSDANIFSDETENSHTCNYCHISKSTCTVVKLYTYMYVIVHVYIQ